MPLADIRILFGDTDPPTEIVFEQTSDLGDVQLILFNSTDGIRTRFIRVESLSSTSTSLQICEAHVLVRGNGQTNHRVSRLLTRVLYGTSVSKETDYRIDEPKYIRCF